MSGFISFKDVYRTNLTFHRLGGQVAQMLMILMLAFTLVGMNSSHVSAAGTTFYVDKTNPACSDATTGPQGTFDVPFCSLSRGALKAITPGDIVQVIAGTYAETIYPASGAAGNPITFRANPGVTVTGQPGTSSVAYSAFAISLKSYVVIDGFTITQTSAQGIYVDSSDHITLTNNHVSYAGASSLFHPYEQGIYLKNTTYSTIRNNVTDHNTCIGIRLTNNSNNNLISNNTSFSNFSVIETDAAGIEMTGSSYNTILNNITYSNEDTGINLYATHSGVPSSYNLVIGNLSYENGDHGIDNYQSPYNTIIGNTVHGNGTVGINFEGELGSGSHHATVANNIISGNGFTPPIGSFGGNLRVDSNSITGMALDYNLFDIKSATVQMIWDNNNYVSLAAFRAAVPGQELHGLEGDPLFVAPVPSVLRQTGVPYVGAEMEGDYYLKPGSPAIDSANANAPSQPLTDINGNARVDDPATPNTGAGVRTYDDRGAYEYLPWGRSLPTVTTQAVTNILATSATGNGNVTALGVPNPTQHGVVWSTSANPTTADNKTTDGPLSATGAFTSSITGLAPGTQYHVRAYATNTEGTVYGNDLTFTTLIVPTVTTQAVANILTTSATGNGNVTVLGVPNPTQHGVVWSTSANPTTADNKTTDGPLSATGAFTSSITGLTPGALYHVRAYATNTAATVYGEDVTFTALRVPIVTTQDITNITLTSATGNGNVIVLGIPNPTQHGIVWSTSPNPTTADNKTTAGAVSATGAFTGAMGGLTPGTQYHVRAYATNAAGTAYGADVTFTTFLVPRVTTQAVTAITATSATGNGIVNALGIPNPTQHGVVWSTLANPTVSNSKTMDGPFNFPDTFTSSITGLTPGTQYHVRAYATNAGGTAYGADVTFTTLVMPVVTTRTVTAITAASANVNGNVIILGVPNPTQHGVVWGTSPNPTILDSKTTDGPLSAAGAFTSSIAGLTQGTLYYVRAYATNAGGTAYGNELTFRTLVVPTVTTQAVTAITAVSATGHGNITALGTSNPTQHGVVWSTSINPTIADNKTTDGPLSTVGAFTSSITGLTPGILYHVRAYATNTAGTAYGNDVTFSTPYAPTVTTQAVSNTTQTSVTGNGNITALGVPNPTQHGFVWGTWANPTTSNQKTVDGPVSATGAFTSNITGLTPGMLYHVRAYATNTAGTSYGSDIIFTTLLAPTVTTQAVSAITADSATGNGNIIALGIPNPTQHGFVWATTPDPTLLDSNTTDGPVSAAGVFTSKLTGLAMGTQYHVRAYATNAAGTVYGEDVTFTTLSGTVFQYHLPLVTCPDTTGN